jgi:hypothetical protein
MSSDYWNISRRSFVTSILIIPRYRERKFQRQHLWHHVHFRWLKQAPTGKSIDTFMMVADVNGTALRVTVYIQLDEGRSGSVSSMMQRKHRNHASSILENAGVSCDAGPKPVKPAASFEKEFWLRSIIELLQARLDL